MQAGRRRACTALRRPQLAIKARHATELPGAGCQARSHEKGAPVRVFFFLAMYLVAACLQGGAVWRFPAGEPPTRTDLTKGQAAASCMGGAAAPADALALRERLVKTPAHRQHGLGRQAHHLTSLPRLQTAAANRAAVRLLSLCPPCNCTSGQPEGGHAARRRPRAAVGKLSAGDKGPPTPPAA